MGLVPLEEAQRFVLDACVAVPAVEEVPLADADGLVLFDQVRAAGDVPPFANTAMDGFAVRAADTAPGARLRVVGTLPAGADPASLHVGPGDAVRIMTGAPIPAGADAVVMVERTSVEGDNVVLEIAVEAGNHVRAAGEDMQSGAVVFEPGTVLGPAHLGVLASAGCATAPVWPRPTVGVLSTGDELVPVDVALGPGQIRDSNRYSLLALTREAGARAVDLGVARDDEGAITAALERAFDHGCDAVVTSGGVSVGDFDFVKVVLDRMTDGSPVPMRWLQIAIKPAKPFAFGVVAQGQRSMAVFGLPGNPASSMVSFELLVRPALRRLRGIPAAECMPTPVGAVAGEDLRRTPDGKVHFVRVTCRWSPERDAYVVHSSGGQGSNLLRSLALADGLAVLADGDGARAGDRVAVLLLGAPR